MSRLHPSLQNSPQYTAATLVKPLNISGTSILNFWGSNFCHLKVILELPSAHGVCRPTKQTCVIQFPPYSVIQFFQTVAYLMDVYKPISITFQSCIQLSD